MTTIYDEINSVWDVLPQENAKRLLSEAGFEFKKVGSTYRCKDNGKICIWENGNVTRWSEGWFQRDPIKLTEKFLNLQTKDAVEFLTDFLNIDTKLPDEEKSKRHELYKQKVEEIQTERIKREQEWEQKKPEIFNNFIKVSSSSFVQDNEHYYSILDFRGIPCEFRERADVFYTEPPILNAVETKEGKKFSIPRRSVIFLNNHDKAFKSISLIDETNDLVKEYDIPENEVKRGHKIKQAMRSFGKLVFPYIDYKKAKNVVFVESEFDALILQGFGISAQSNKAPFDDVENFLCLKTAFAFYDNDEAGNVFTEKLKEFCDLTGVSFYDLRSVVGEFKDLGDYVEALQKDQLKLADLKIKIKSEIANKLEQERIQDIIEESEIVNQNDYKMFERLKLFTMSSGFVLGVRKDTNSHVWSALPVGGDEDNTIISINQALGDEYNNRQKRIKDKIIKKAEKEICSCTSLDEAEKVLLRNFPRLYVEMAIVSVKSYSIKTKVGLEQHFSLEYNNKAMATPTALFYTYLKYYSQTSLFTGKDLKIISNDPMEDSMFYIDIDSIPDNLETPTWDKTMEKFEVGAEEFKAFVYSIFCAKNNGRQALWIYDLNGKVGKSAIIKAICSLFPSEKDVGSIDSVATMDKFTFSKFWNKRLAVCGDCKNQFIIKSEFMHKLLGGDPVDVDYKMKTSFTAIPQTKVIIASNAKPKINEDSVHEASRVIPVLMSLNNLSPEEQEKIRTSGDKSYAEKLISEMRAFLGKCRTAYRNLCETETDIKLTPKTEAFLKSCTDGSSEEARSVVEECFEKSDSFVLTSSEIKKAIGGYCFKFKLKDDPRNIESTVREWLTREAGEPKKGKTASGTRVVGFAGWTLKKEFCLNLTGGQNTYFEHPEWNREYEN